MHINFVGNDQRDTSLLASPFALRSAKNRISITFNFHALRTTAISGILSASFSRNNSICFFFVSLQREINEVFEQRRKSEQTTSIPNHGRNDGVNHGQLPRSLKAHRASEPPPPPRQNATQALERRQNISRTNDWAAGILKDLDGLMVSEQRYSDAQAALRYDSSSPDAGPMSPNHKRSTVINVVLRKTAPTPSPIPLTAPKMTKLRAASDGRTVSNAAINASATAPTAPAPSTTSTTPSDNHRILKPEKHVSSLTHYARPRS